MTRLGLSGEAADHRPYTPVLADPGPVTDTIPIMRAATGLERMLVPETNVSDLIQFFASEDPRPLADLLGVHFDDVARESATDGKHRADLVLRSAIGPVAAIELKVGHEFHHDQQAAYEKWAASHQNPRLVLCSFDADPDLPGWAHYTLPDLIRSWLGSPVPVVAALSERVCAVLDDWDRIIRGVTLPATADGSLTFADVTHKALMRIITRFLAAAQRDEDVWTRATKSSGGGAPILQTWTPIDGVPDVYFIADARFENTSVHLRFGVDGEKGAGREAWRLAQDLDRAITMTAFKNYLAGLPDGDLKAHARFEQRGSVGRPARKGDWSAAIEAGKKAAGTTSGFLGDGFTRYECGARIARTDLNSWSLSLLMAAVHDHLAHAWRVSSDR